jgi:hypothetical protein
MEDVLEFQPDEFQVMDTFEFEEEIQRPENLRLFTLEDQLLDYFSVRMPKGKTTRFHITELANEIDRVRDAYLSTVEVTETLYDVKKHQRVSMPSWIHPTVDDFELKGFDYHLELLPMYRPEQRMLPQYISRLVRALPKPYDTPQSENPPIDTNIVGRTSDGKTEVRAVGKFQKTKTVLHEDGTQEIVSEDISNTQDNIRINGYALEERPLDLPNPQQGHPFLESTQASTYKTTQAFGDVYPSVQAIFSHAIPTTADPYNEGMKYLKLYDIKLSEIPWSSWKSRFPPVEQIDTPSPVKSLTFPNTDSHDKPSEKLETLYVKKWFPGIHPRYWMMQQEDAGITVMKMLLSLTGNSGNVPIEVLGETLERKFNETTPEECIRTDTFHNFLESGISRIKKLNEKGHTSYECVPVSIVREERREWASKGRLMWKESLEADIMRKHQVLLKRFQGEGLGEKAVKYAVHKARENSEIRRDILTLLKDPRRTEMDKAEAVEDMLKDIIPSDNLYLDVEGGMLVCGHTLSVLKGNLADDDREFYREWTAIEDGKRVCRYCGEQVGNVFVIQDEFDNDGRLLVSQSALKQDGFHGESQVDVFTNSLKELRKVFDLDNPGESVLYLVLSLLQILPTDTQLLPILQYIRNISKVLKAAAKAKKFTIETENRIYGAIGLAASVVLIQTHQPFLIPTRWFGSRPLVLTGYPRDTNNKDARGILDTLIFVLKNTFESFPSTFRGSIVPFFRSLLTKPKDLRNETNTYIKRALDVDFKAQFVLAKERYETSPMAVMDRDSTLPLMFLEKTEFKPSESLTQEPVRPMCLTVKPLVTLEPKLGPNVTQLPLPLWSNIRPSETSVTVPIPKDMSLELKGFTDAEIRKNISLKFPKLKLKSLEEFLDREKDGIAIVSLLQRLLDIMSTEETFSQNDIQSYRNICVLLKTEIGGGLLRDSAKGLTYKFLHSIAKHPNVSGFETNLATALKNDIVIRMIFVKPEDAEKEQNILRARERETLKERLRGMTDSEREITKKLLDIGIAPYIITNADREMFKQEYNIREEPDVFATGFVDENRPEEGYNDNRDYEDDTEPIGQNGQTMNVDTGDYGDMAQRDYNDYTGNPQYNDDEGYGF